MNAESGSMLVERAVEALRAHGLLVAVRDGDNVGLAADGQSCLRVGRGISQVEYLAAARPGLTRRRLSDLLNELRQAGSVQRVPLLLITEHITPTVANHLRKAEQQFADVAGNAYLEGGGLFVFVTGRKLDVKAEACRASRHFAQIRLKVLTALISDPDLAGASDRAIAAAADVSPGMMPVVMADLQRSGALLAAGDRRTLNCQRRLLDEWAEAYAVGLRSRTLVGRYRAESFALWPEWQIAKAGACWGGEPAAVLLGGDLSPTVLTIYGESLPPRLISQQRLVPAGVLDYENLLELRKPLWNVSPGTSVRGDCVPPALVYADLLATGNGRCLDEAKNLYERWLAGTFPDITLPGRRSAVA